MWQDYNFRLLVASFGASAVLLYGVPESKLSQPRNLIGVFREYASRQLSYASFYSSARRHFLQQQLTG
jgi:CBS-domain-containing membrane protein